MLSDQLDITLALLAEVPAGGSATERMRTFIRLQVEHVASTPDELVVFFQELPRASLVSELADFVMSGVAPAHSVPEYVTGRA